MTEALNISLQRILYAAGPFKVNEKVHGVRAHWGQTQIENGTTKLPMLQGLLGYLPHPQRSQSPLCGDNYSPLGI